MPSDRIPLVVTYVDMELAKPFFFFLNRNTLCLQFRPQGDSAKLPSDGEKGPISAK